MFKLINSLSRAFLEFIFLTAAKFKDLLLDVGFEAILCFQSELIRYLIKNIFPHKVHYISEIFFFNYFLLLFYEILKSKQPRLIRIHHKYLVKQNFT